MFKNRMSRTMGDIRGVLSSFINVSVFRPKADRAHNDMLYLTKYQNLNVTQK